MPPSLYDFACPPGTDLAFLSRVRALVPRIAEAAGQIERDRRVPEPILNDLLDLGLFRLMIPRSIDGLEANPLTYMHALELIAGADASTAWNIGQTAVCGIVSAYLRPDVARAVFSDRRAILAWGPPDGEARAVASEGGYRVSGRWNFASGGRHATWLGAYAPIFNPDGTPWKNARGEPVNRVFLFPAQSVEMVDTWDVIGLRGTASDAFALKDRFIAEEYSVNRDDPVKVHEPGWVYRFRTTNLYACGFACVAMGAARSMLDSFVELAMKKTPRGYNNPLRENAATQNDLAVAEAGLRSARTFLMQAMSEACQWAQKGNELTMEQRVTIRLAATHAILRARDAADFAYEGAGASAIFAANPFERRFRDVHTVAQQVQGRRSHFQTVGKFLLGIEPETLFL